MEIEWTSQASSDLEAIRVYIAKDNERAAYELLDRIVSTVEELLPAQPEVGRPGRINGTRELVIPASSYIAPYRLKNTRIQILAVFHGSQQFPDKL